MFFEERVEEGKSWRQKIPDFFCMGTYKMRDEATMRRILVEFELNPDTGRIINGHVPVRVKRGQRPILANGKLLVINGGMAKAYQAVTGIAGGT